VAKSINTLFGDAPFRLPEVVRGLVDGFWLGKKLHVEVDVAPLESGNIQFVNMIVVGGTPKNSVRRYYMDAGLPWVEVVGEDRPSANDVFARTLSPRLRIRKGKHTSEEIPGSHNVAIVEKIVDGEHRTTVFFCVGFRGDCSRGAVEYLARNWRTLHHWYGNQPFAVCLGFPRSENEMESYMAPDILRQIQT
jgi:hypothetical protein